MGFVGDLKESQVIVLRLIDWLIDSGKVAHELEGKKEQKLGDLVWYTDNDSTKPVYVEVKYDKMAAKTGNLCFEVGNSKKQTGIMSTGANFVYYVVPNGDGLDVLVFGTQSLREFLIKGGDKVRKVKGGDGWKFQLCLVKRSDIDTDDITKSIYHISSDGTSKKVK